MDMIEQKINTKDYLTKSNLPASDYVINPYVGCTHACKYCYARFMKRFTGHKEEWGKFIDIKQCEKPEYSDAAEPPVRCGVSHLSGQA